MDCIRDAHSSDQQRMLLGLREYAHAAANGRMCNYGPTELNLSFSLQFNIPGVFCATVCSHQVQRSSHCLHGRGPLAPPLCKLLYEGADLQSGGCNFELALLRAYVGVYRAHARTLSRVACTAFASLALRDLKLWFTAGCDPCC